MRSYHYLSSCVLCMGVCVVLCPLVVSSKDLYRTLGVSRSASENDIKNAYRKQAKLWHPDKNKSPDARERFTGISEAYEVLSDSLKKRNYDLTGRVGETPPQHTGFPRGQGFTFHQGGFRFVFPSGPTHRSDGISTQQFYDDVLSNSHHKPYLLNFYSDFCMHCANVEMIWKALHMDLSSQGVGLGSVHARQHPRITQHCGVSRIPSVIGVVSGRVHHYYGQLRDKNTLITFLDNILPKHIITLVTEDNIDLFLFEAIARNRPRLVLFTPRESPSLLYKLTAFAHQRVADFGLVSTMRGDSVLLRRFGLRRGEKRLAVFKESLLPTSVSMGPLDRSVLQSAVEGVTLLLPRLSSQYMLDTICPLASISFCVILLVNGPAQYNDSLTAAFRRLPAETASLLDGFSYIDSTTQDKFLAPLVPISGGVCSSGITARPILILSRAYNRFSWFDGFCGSDSDSLFLSHLSSLRAKSDMKPTPRLPSLNDEEAPGWLGQIWNKITEFVLDFNDFFLALESGVYTPMMSLLFAVLVICMVGLCLGSPDDSDSRKLRNSRSIGSTEQDNTHSNGPHTPTSQMAIQNHLYEMNQSTYETFVEGKEGHAQLAVVILVDSQNKIEARQMVQAFRNVTSCYKDARLRICYLCHRTNETWLKSLLEQCAEMRPEEIGKRVVDCLSGSVATVVALLGFKKQLCIFPNNEFSEFSNSHSNEQLRTQSVGDILGSLLDFNDDSPPSKAGENNGVTEDSIYSRAEQVRKNFEMWMEKFADGSLKRYRVTNWPTWM